MSNLTRKRTTRNYDEKLVNMPTNTRENTQAAINNFTKFVLEKHECTPDKICGDLIEIKKTDGEGDYEDTLYSFLQEWIDWNISIKTGAYTIRTRFSILRKYLYFLGIKTNSQDINQLLDFPRKIVEEKYAIKKQEIRDLVLAQSRNPKRQALYLACSSSGMRLGEALHIKKKDLDFSLERIMIRVNAEYTKTKVGRTTFVSKECEEKIMMYYEKLDDDEYVFSNSKSDFKKVEYYHKQIIKIPKNWDWKTIGEYEIGITTGSTPSRKKPEFFDGNILWVTSGELNYNKIKDTIEHISQDAVKKKPKNLKIRPIGTVMIAITGLEAEGTRGRCAVLGKEATMNQSCAAFEMPKNIDPLYLFYFYQQFSEKIYWTLAQGTKQQSLPPEIIKEIKFPVPPPEEQQEILNVLSNVNSIIEKQQDIKSGFEIIRKGLMQKLLTGQIRVKI